MIFYRSSDESSAKELSERGGDGAEEGLEKARRQRLMLDIVKGKTIRTQEEFLRSLEERGIVVSQGTISRDIKDLGLVKVPGKDGLMRYAAPQTDGARVTRAAHTVRKLVLSLVENGSLVVARTSPARAGEVADAVLDLGLGEVLGCFPYGAAVLIVGASDDGARRCAAHLRGLLE